VIIINCEQITVTGNRMTQKRYYRHSQYNGGLTSLTLEQLMQKHPDRAIKSAVKGMLPKNALGRAMFKKLKVYKGDHHPHEAQRPKMLEIKEA
jgi:large subunit ribosomal protein L13